MDKLEKLDWPSDRVSKGGIFHPQKVVYSKDTHDLIKCKKKYGSQIYNINNTYCFFFSADGGTAFDDVPTQ